MLKFVPDHLMTKKMTNMQLKTTFHDKTQRPKKYVIKPPICILLQYNLFLNNIGLKKCLRNLLTFVCFVFNSVSDWYKTQEMCDRIASVYGNIL